MTINEIFDHIDEMFAEKRISEVEPFLSQQLRLAETAGEQDKVIAMSWAVSTGRPAGTIRGSLCTKRPWMP